MQKNRADSSNTFSNTLIKNFFVSLPTMGKEAIDIAAIVAYLKNQPVDKVWLFGSYASGNARVDSDVDLLISYLPEARVGMLKHAEIILQLEDILEKPVDLVPEDSLNENIKPYVIDNRVIIYERGN